MTQYNSRSLNEHLSSSKWWDFGRKQGGLFVFTPTITTENSFWYQGTADAIYQNLDFLKEHAMSPMWSSLPVTVCTSWITTKFWNTISQKKADITVVCKELPSTRGCDPLRCAEDERGLPD